MENSIIGRGGSVMSNSIIRKNIVYFITRPLFEAIKLLIFFKIFHNFGQKGGGGGCQTDYGIFHNFFYFFK